MHRKQFDARTALRRVWFAALALAAAATWADPLPAQTAISGRATRTVVVPVGGAQRVSLTTRKAIRSVLNEKEQVAQVSTLAETTTEVLVRGLAEGATRVELTDVDGNREVVELLVQRDFELIRTTIARVTPTASVEVIPTVGGVVVLKGTVQNAGDVDTILRIAGSIIGGGPERIINAMTVGGVQTVQLDVIVAQVSRAEARSIGFNFSTAGGTLTLGNSTGLLQAFTEVSPTSIQSDIGTRTNIVFGLVPSNFLGFIQALREERLAKLLAEPRVVTTSGRPAYFNSGGQQAVPVVSAFAGAVGTDFVPFGTQLSVLPIVMGDGRIYLEVEPSVSVLNAANGFTSGGTVVAGRDVQTVRTSVTLEPGQTLAIGGLIQNQVQASATKVPVLGDIPYLAPFFSTIQHSEIETELVILVTPRLVDAQDHKQVSHKLPGMETRAPDDCELFLEFILEAPRGQRKSWHDRHFRAAYLNDQSASQYPCNQGGSGAAHGGNGHANPNCDANGNPLPPAAALAPMAATPGSVPAPVMTPAPVVVPQNVPVSAGPTPNVSATAVAPPIMTPAPLSFGALPPLGAPQ